MLRELNIFFNRSKFFIKFYSVNPIIYVEGKTMFESYSTKDVEKQIESYHCFLAKGINERNIFMSVGKHFFDENRVFISTIRAPKTVTYKN